MNVKIAGIAEVIGNINLIKKNNINLISIRDSNPSSLKNGYDIIDKAELKNLLAITFDDVSDRLPPQYNRTKNPPKESDIKTILEWAKQKMTENSNDFMVHCTAGVSRSSAVAILIKYMEDPVNTLNIINPMLHSPNLKILSLGEKILNVKGIKEQVGELFEKCDERFLR